MGRNCNTVRTCVHRCSEETTGGSVQEPVEPVSVRSVLNRDPGLLSVLHYRFFQKYFATSTGWSLTALFSILRDLRDLALEVTSQLLQRHRKS